jgi:ATP-binding cassette subfamily B protein
MNCGKNEKYIKDHSIEFKDVVFSYEGADKRAVDNISFKLNEGETVALVGASGGGKTTIARLAARFWDVDEGEILVGGINVKKIPKEKLMDNISFVFQNTKLFKGPLRENIVFGKKNAGQEEIEKAIDFSQSREIINDLSDGLDTVIGTKGTYLSGGEQQRIALARAFVKNAPIVLLDEATAFADPENEHLIQKALKELSRGKTTLMIAHRLTSVRNVDRILVIESGKIAEEGTHEDLLKKGGLYKTMWDEYQKSIEWKIAVNDRVNLGGQYA